MFSNIPSALLYCSIPFIFCPALQNSIAVGGYSLSGYQSYTLSYLNPKGLGLSFRHHSLGDFAQLNTGLNTTLRLNESFTVSPGLALLHNQQYNLSNNRITLNVSGAYTQQKTQSILFISHNVLTNYTEFVAGHLYQIDPKLRVGATWSSFQNSLELNLHYLFKGQLLSYRQNRDYLQIAYALKKKHVWLKIAFNTGSLISPPLLVAQW